jgi:hypothetical protein
LEKVADFLVDSGQSPRYNPPIDGEQKMKRGEAINSGMGYILERVVDGETIQLDVWIDFTATCVGVGYKGDYYQPPESPEFELEINEIIFDLPRGCTQEGVEGGPLTQLEIDEITAWFENQEIDA